MQRPTLSKFHTYLLCTMKTPDALLAWFEAELTSLPDDNSSTAELLQLLKDPPIGITRTKLMYKSVPLTRSGPKGWTYFPANADGTRLARLSYASLVPGVYVTATVKLFSKAFTAPDTESYTVSDFAILTVDNLTSHGKAEKRRPDPSNKRRKLCVHH